MNTKDTFSGFSGQLVVVCLTGLFLVIALVAMFTTAKAENEVDWIGITAKPLGGEKAAAQGIPSAAGGVVVDEVEGIAERAGVRPGDVLVAINGNRVKNMNDFSLLTSETDLSKGGARLDMIRRGSRIPVLVTAAGQQPVARPRRRISQQPRRSSTVGGSA
jgi:S1-C subfamily serine protease